MFRPYKVNTHASTTTPRIPLNLIQYNNVHEWCEPVPTFWNIPPKWILHENNIVQHKRTRRILTLVPRMPYYGYDEKKEIYVHLMSGYTTPKLHEEELVYERNKDT